MITPNFPPATGDASRAVVDQLIARGHAALQAGDESAATPLLEQALALDPRRPRPLQWLAAIRFRGGDFATAAQLLARTVALVPDNLEARHNLAIALAQTGRLDAAIEQLRQLLALKDDHLSARLHLGFYLQQSGAIAPACGEFIAALRQVHLVPGLLESATPQMRHLLGEGRKLVRDSRHAAVDSVLGPLRERHGAEALARIQACFDGYIEQRRPEEGHPLQQPATLYIPGLVPRPFFEREDFPWIGQLEAAYPVILDELRALLGGDEEGFQPYIQLDPESRRAAEWGSLNRSPDWSAFHLYRHGRPIAANAARCPRTMEVLETLPLMRIPRHAPEVLFSVLRPKARIPRHHGSINGRLIVHLPLIVPPDCGALWAAGEARSWEPGRCLIFDDSFLHEAWNDSEQTRVVMLLDLWNPQLSVVEQEAFAAALAAVDEFNVAAVGKPDFVFD